MSLGQDGSWEDESRRVPVKPLSCKRKHDVKHVGDRSRCALRARALMNERSAGRHRPRAAAGRREKFATAGDAMWAKETSPVRAARRDHWRTSTSRRITSNRSSRSARFAATDAMLRLACTTSSTTRQHGSSLEAVGRYTSLDAQTLTHNCRAFVFGAAKLCTLSVGGKEQLHVCHALHAELRILPLACRQSRYRVI